MKPIVFAWVIAVPVVALCLADRCSAQLTFVLPSVERSGASEPEVERAVYSMSPPPAARVGQTPRAATIAVRQVTALQPVAGASEPQPTLEVLPPPTPETKYEQSNDDEALKGHIHLRPRRSK